MHWHQSKTQAILIIDNNKSLILIIKNTNDGWHIIYQAAHGLLAGKIANHLDHRFRNRYWSETFTAITEHDDHQLNFDEKDYLNELGVPVNFTENKVSNEKALERAKRIYHKSLAKSKWTTLMVYFHLNFLYGDMEYETMQAFLKKSSTIKPTTYKLYGVNEEEAEATYQILRFCDRLSLILCQDEIPSSERDLEINTSIENKTYKVSKRDTGEITVAPWCFQEDSFELSVEERILQKASFETNHKLKEALEKAEVTLKTWQFKRA